MTRRQEERQNESIGRSWQDVGGQVCFVARTERAM